MKLPRVREGDVVTDALFNALLAAAEGANLEAGAGLSLERGPNGYTLGTTMRRPFYAKITGAISGGTYPFTQQFPAAGGTWTAGPLTGVAYEVNGNTSVPVNTYVEMRWNAAGFYEFAAGSC